MLVSDRTHPTLPALPVKKAFLLESLKIMPLSPTFLLFYIMLPLLITKPHYNTLHSCPIHILHKIPLNKGLLLHL